MKVFFDTSVLVAASSGDHPQYNRAFPALQRSAKNQDTGLISAHSIAEVYCALTRMPVVPRIHPIEASRIITDNLLTHLEVISLDKSDYMDALQIVRDGGWAGAKIYDALILCCAAKCNAERIYTFNLRDFRPLASLRLQERLCAP